MPSGDTPDPPADGDRSSGWWKLRPVATLIALGGFAITALLMWAAATANTRSNASLLQLQARQTAAVLTAELPSVQSHLEDALSAAEDTNSTAFVKFVTSTHDVGKSGFVSESLWERTGTGVTLISSVGTHPRVALDKRFLDASKPSTTMLVTPTLAANPRRIGFAWSPPGTTYIVYATDDLPSSTRLAVPTSSPYHDLDYALYFGSVRPSHLVEASLPTPVTAAHATVTVPFGNSVVTLIAVARTPLTPWTSHALPWIILGAGLVLSLASAAAVQYLSFRRRVATELGNQLGVLYAQQHSIALTLQHALLPERLPTLPGLEIDARYLPGAAGVEVGGDWYDVVPVDDTRLVFVVGDVSGRGVRAAAVMAALRFASRAFAVEGHSPSAILDRLGKTVEATEGQFATVLCGVVDLARREVTLANAGHLPPILVNNGAATVIEVPPNPPIGVRHQAPAQEVVVHPARGAVLLAYTDGLVERRGESLDQGITRLKKSAIQEAPDIDTLLGLILSDLMTDGTNDDVALIGLKWLT